MKKAKFGSVCMLPVCWVNSKPFCKTNKICKVGDEFHGDLRSSDFARPSTPFVRIIVVDVFDEFMSISFGHNLYIYFF